MLSKLCKRLIPCLDVANGRTVKGVNFQGLRDVGDPVELAIRYEEEGADELVFLDITATVENRGTLLKTVEAVAERLRIPFTVGGGIKCLADADILLANGADKVSINSAAVATPELVTQIANKYGSQCCVVAIDARSDKRENEQEQLNGDSRTWHVLVHGGRKQIDLDAYTWGKEVVERGAGEILLTSWDRDGTQEGFDLPMVSKFAKTLSVPVIASGGAAGADCFTEVFLEAEADAALAASIFHDGHCTVNEIKTKLKENNVEVRL